jgi:hypothetical protein
MKQITRRLQIMPRRNCLYDFTPETTSWVGDQPARNDLPAVSYRHDLALETSCGAHPCEYSEFPQKHLTTN